MLDGAAARGMRRGNRNKAAALAVASPNPNPPALSLSAIGIEETSGDREGKG